MILRRLPASLHKMREKKYHQVSPTFLIVIHYMFAAIYSFYIEFLVCMLVTPIMQNANLALSAKVLLPWLM